MTIVSWATAPEKNAPDSKPDDKNKRRDPTGNFLLETGAQIQLGLESFLVEPF
jgi:hypothetical protein